MARKAAPKHVEPEDESQDLPEEQAELEAAEPEDEPQAGDTMSKSAAARAAIEAGHDSPDDAVDFIRRQFGIEMTKPHFSAVKSQMKKRDGEPTAKRGRKPREASAEPRPATPAAKPAPAPGGDMIDDLTAIKHLVERLGAEQVRKIVGLFE